MPLQKRVFNHSTCSKSLERENYLIGEVLNSVLKDLGPSTCFTSDSKQIILGL